MEIPGNLVLILSVTPKLWCVFGEEPGNDFVFEHVAGLELDFENFITFLHKLTELSVIKKFTDMPLTCV